FLEFHRNDGVPIRHGESFMDYRLDGHVVLSCFDNQVTRSRGRRQGKRPVWSALHVLPSKGNTRSRDSFVRAGFQHAAPDDEAARQGDLEVHRPERSTKGAITVWCAA